MSYMMIARMVLLFLMQLLICEVCFFVGLPRRDHFGRNAFLALAEFLALTALLNVVRIATPDGGNFLLRELEGIAYFAGLIFVNALVALQCFAIRYREALFAVIGGYSIEHIASRFS